MRASEQQPPAETSNAGAVPATLAHPAARRFWIAVVLIGIGAGVSAAALTFVLDTVQQWVWPSPNANILEAATRAGFWRPVLALTGAGIVTGIGQLVLVSLPT